MKRTNAAVDLDDAITVQQPEAGRWAWVDEGYDGPGTGIVEWIDIVEHAAVLVHEDGTEMLELNANEVADEGFLSETRWLRSSRWVDIEERR